LSGLYLLASPRLKAFGFHWLAKIIQYVVRDC